MNRASRTAATEILSSQGTLLAHCEHEIYLVAHKLEAGLVPKEKQFLLARHKAIQQELEKLSKLTRRLRKT